jgi:hypothetical protein
MECFSIICCEQQHPIFISLHLRAQALHRLSPGQFLSDSKNTCIQRRHMQVFGSDGYSLNACLKHFLIFTI